jgi:hypothetical protein
MLVFWAATLWACRYFQTFRGNTPVLALKMDAVCSSETLVWYPPVSPHGVTVSITALYFSYDQMEIDDTCVIFCKRGEMSNTISNIVCFRDDTAWTI